MYHQTIYYCNNELLISEQAGDWDGTKELTCMSIKLLEGKEASKRLLSYSLPLTSSASFFLLLLRILVVILGPQGKSGYSPCFKVSP